MAKTYQQRSGTSNDGYEYEILNIANLAMTLVSDDRIKDFQISSNDKDFGAFDDIVLEVEVENRTELFALQLKHVNKSTLSIDQLKRKSGNFSISTYFQSVQSIKRDVQKYILYTNLKFEIKNKVPFQLEDEEFYVEILKCQSTEQFQISDKTNFYYKLQIVEDSSTSKFNSSEKISKYKTFFDNFYLYVDQENVKSLEHNVVQRFNNLFSANQTEIDQHFLKIISKWYQTKGTKEKLNKEWMQRAVALQMLSSNIQPLFFSSVGLSSSDATKIDRRNMICEAIQAFDITLFGTESYDQVKQLWADSNCQLDLVVLNKLRTKYQLTPTPISDIAKVDPKILSILLWLMGKCPLILTQGANTHKAIKLCFGEKFILLTDDYVDLFTDNICVFKTLSELKIKQSQYKQLLQKFKCSLQGKEPICLESLLKNNEEMSTVLRTDDLLKMSAGQCAIGEGRENLPDPYIDRCLSKNVIDVKLLENISTETVIILDCMSEKVDLQNKLTRHNVINISDSLEVGKKQTSPVNIERTSSFEKQSQINFSNLSTTTIYFSEKRCEYNEFQAICNKTENAKHFHQFRVRENGHLEWIRSKGSVNDIEKFKLSGHYAVQESNLSFSEFRNNINLLVSDSGMGKTELTKSFKTKHFSDRFTVIVDPKDVFSFLKNTHESNNYVDAFQKFILDEKYKMFSERDTEILRIFLKKNKIIYVWDALDELSDEHRSIVINIIVELSKDCLQWVTSRCHLQNMLERKFNVFSLSLTKFIQEEQRNYIRKRLADNDDNESIKKTKIIIEKIESTFLLVEHKDILGIPLQLFMLTELFRQDREKYLGLLNNSFLLTDLYNYFIEEKFKIHYREKLGIDLNTSYALEHIQSQKGKILEEYTIAALKLLFPDAILTQLGFQHEQIFRVIDETHINIGLVTGIEDQIPQFLHNSFAEYLVACHFATKFEQTGCTHKEVLAQVMFDSRYINVRFFFDLRLARNSEAHVAILYKNFNFLKSCDVDILRSTTDVGGRSLLHLVCSWGQRYPKLNVKYIEDTYVVDHEGLFSTVPDHYEYIEAIDFLLEISDFSKSDEIYNMTPIEYARQGSCLEAEMIMMMMRQNTAKSIENEHIINILYYAAFHGYSGAFTFFFELFEQNFIEPGDSTTERKPRSVVANVKNSIGTTLLCIAAEMGHENIVQFLIKANADINLANKDGWTPLIAASVRGYDIIVEFLIKASADINLANTNGFTPLIAASANGHYKVVELLVQAGADINLANTNGFTPLFAASAKGHYKVVELLVQADADINLANKQNWTPLLTASFNGHDRIVEVLVKASAGINLDDKDGNTPLHAASCEGYYKVVAFLVKAGANINLANKNGFTPLNTACGEGHEKIVEFLSNAGADINLANNYGWTPLMIASSNGHDKIVELLAKAGADINHANKYDWTPLITASSKGHDKVVEILIKANVDINSVNTLGYTPLNIACLTGHDKVVELLVKAGADINLADKDGFTPLNAVCLEGRYKFVELLVKAGANINLANKKGFTPLNTACGRGHEKIVEFLRNADADINLANKYGWTPLIIASSNGHDKIVELLVKAGANINLASKDGFTPLHAASLNGHKDVCVFLVHSGADINYPAGYNVTPLLLAKIHRHEEIVAFLAESGGVESNTTFSKEIIFVILPLIVLQIGIELITEFTQ